LTGNQTKEDVDAKFVELTKAYKVLTDETIRRNFELYGHPDGKQDFGMGIAIPKSFIAAQNNGYIIGVYAILFGVALPFFVGRWWFGSKRVTKDGILNVTAATLYLNMKEDMSFARAVEIVSASTEMEQYLAKSTAIKSSEFDRLQNQVKEQLKTVAGERMDGQLFRQKSCQRAASSASRSTRPPCWPTSRRLSRRLTALRRRLRTSSSRTAG
jgi:translocation protein SEC63